MNGSCRVRHGYSWLAGALWTPGPADPWSPAPAVGTRRIAAVAWRAAAAWLVLAAVPVAAGLAATRWHGGPAVVSVVVAVAVYLPLTWVLSGTTRAGSPAWQRRAGGWVLVGALAVTLVPGYLGGVLAALAARQAYDKAVLLSRGVTVVATVTAVHARPLRDDGSDYRYSLAAPDGTAIFGLLDGGKSQTLRAGDQVMVVEDPAGQAPAATPAALGDYDAEITVTLALAALVVPAVFGAIVRTGPSSARPPSRHGR